MNTLKVTLDTNIWFSSAMGGRISQQLPLILANKNIVVFHCKETIFEFEDTTSRTKNQKLFSSERVHETRTLMDEFTQFVPIISPIILISRDPNDDHLLALSKDYDLDYLVTGDKDLLVLKTYGNTRICTFTEFVVELEKLALI